MREPTPNKILRKEHLAVLRHVCPAMNLERGILVLADAVRVEGSIPPHLDLALPQVLDEEGLHHALMNEENVGIQHVNDGWIMYLATEAVEGLLSSAAPKGNVVDSDASL